VRLALACCVAAGCGTSGSVCGPSSGIVERVIDGDTVVLTTGEKIVSAARAAFWRDRSGASTVSADDRQREDHVA
jgi:hypothetical protein